LVFAADGQETGLIADVATDAVGDRARMRFTPAGVLGVDERLLELPRDVLTVMRGTVVVDLPIEAVQGSVEVSKVAHGD
jgi:hypothetical protein